MFGSSLSYLKLLSWRKYHQVKYGPFSLLHFFSIAELTRALSFAIAEEGTYLLNEPFGFGKSSLSAGFEVRRKYFKIDDIFNTRGWSRA